MAYEHREGWGTFRKNPFKDSDKKPDIIGDGMYKGEIVKIAAWRKERDDGKVWFSFNMQPKDQKPLEGKKDEKPREIMDDDIPF